MLYLNGVPYVEHTILLIDASDSMAPYRSQVVGGLNVLLDEFRQSEFRHLVSVVFFASDIDVVVDCVDVAFVDNLNIWQYRTVGCTQMFDAIGKTVDRTEYIYSHIDRGFRPCKTRFIVVSDGATFCDQHYSSRQVRSIVRRKAREGWEFFYLGTMDDVARSARSIGIGESHSARYRFDAMDNLFLGLSSIVMKPAGGWKALIEGPA